MDYNKAALEMHETHKGKVGIMSKVEVATPRRPVHRLHPRRGRALPQDQGKPRGRV